MRMPIFPILKRALLACMIIPGASATFAQPKPANQHQDVVWEVVHRFRTLTNRTQHDHMLSQIFRSNVRARSVAELFGLAEAPATKLFEFKIETPWQEADAQYDWGWYHDKNRRIRVSILKDSLQRSGVPTALLSKVMCSYMLNGTPVAEHPCIKPIEFFAPLGQSKLVWQHKYMTQAATMDIDIKDIKIATLGDSFGSGEGNPMSPYIPAKHYAETQIAGMPATWWDARCHRSLLSSHALAGMRHALANKHTSVTYVNFACSGAEIDDGIRTPYVGRETVDQVRKGYEDVGRDGYPPNGAVFADKLPPQIARLKQLTCKSGTSPCVFDIDTVLISTGGNEVGFGQIVAAVYKSNLMNDRSLAPRIKNYFQKLNSSFSSLKRDIDVLNPKKIYIVGYLDPTKDERGDFCSTSFFRPAVFFALEPIVHVSAAETKYVFKRVIERLEGLHINIARDFGWGYIAGFGRNLGFCARPTYFNSVGAASRIQGALPSAGGIRGGFPTGAMHPNFYGHLHMSGEIQKALQKQ